MLEQVFGNLIVVIVFLFLVAVVVGGLLVGLAIILSIVGWIVEQIHKMTR